MAHADKKQRLQPRYELLYHPGIPGRGEYVRLALEVAGVPYVDVANQQKNGYSEVKAICMTNEVGAGDNPPVFSPPALRITPADSNSTPLVISQTPNILIYLGEKHGLLPSDDARRFHTQQVFMTALDLNDEIHDTHHPINGMDYYEAQKAEALAKARTVRQHRFPKYFSYFERTLQYNESIGKGHYLVGDNLTLADLAVWQVLDGAMFAFPNEMKVRVKEFPRLLDEFYQHLKGEQRLKNYLSSDRRLPYGMGVFRHYEELDRQDE